MVPSAEVLMVAGLQVPVIPLLEVNGSAGAVLFRQRGPIASKTGVTEVAMVMARDVGGAQAPAAAGVNMYTVVPAVLVLITAGNQVPAIPLLEVAGNAGAVLLRQISPITSKVGVVAGVTLILMVTGVAHTPASGVKVYVPEVRLLTMAGAHVPVMPLVEVVGSTGAVVPAQKSGIALKVGVIWLEISTVMVVGTPQVAPVGVNV